MASRWASRRQPPVSVKVSEVAKVASPSPRRGRPPPWSDGPLRRHVGRRSARGRGARAASKASVGSPSTKLSFERANLSRRGRRRRATSSAASARPASGAPRAQDHPHQTPTEQPSSPPPEALLPVLASGRTPASNGEPLPDQPRRAASDAGHVDARIGLRRVAVHRVLRRQRVGGGEVEVLAVVVAVRAAARARATLSALLASSVKGARAGRTSHADAGPSPRRAASPVARTAIRADRS